MNDGIAEFKARSANRRFISELETVSNALAAWASEQIWNNGWSVEDCKIQIRNAMKVCDRD